MELDKVWRDLGGSKDVNDVAAIVSWAARRLVHADGATFVLREGDLVHYVDEDAFSPLWKGKRFPADACVSGHAILHHTSVVVPDISKDARIPMDLYRSTFVRSLAITPIGDGAMLGAIGAYWRTRHEATNEETDALHQLADMTAETLWRLRDTKQWS